MTSTERKSWGQYNLRFPPNMCLLQSRQYFILPFLLLLLSKSSYLKSVSPEMRCWYGSTMFVKPFRDVNCAGRCCATTHRLGFDLYTCVRGNMTTVCNTTATTCCYTFMCNSDNITGQWFRSSSSVRSSSSSTQRRNANLNFLFSCRLWILPLFFSWLTLFAANYGSR